MGMQVSMTAWVSSFLLLYHMTRVVISAAVKLLSIGFDLQQLTVTVSEMDDAEFTLPHKCRTSINK